MKKIFSLFILLYVGTANATLISIDYVFADRSIEFNGVTQNTGGIEISIVADTNTANLGTSFDHWENFYKAEVFFTASGLGLNYEKVVSDTYLYFGETVFGFTDTVGNFGTIFTAYGGATNLAFGNQFDLSTIVVPQGPLATTLNELRTENDIVFANGDRITGGEDSILVSSIASVSKIADVTEPSSLALFGLCLAGIGFSRKKLLRVAG